MWDFKKNKPAEWLFDYFGISTELIPSIVPTFSQQGFLTKTAAAELSLPEGIPLLYRAGDQPNNALSLNVLNPGEIAASGGTSGVVYAVSNQLATKESLRINNFAHVNHTPENPRIGKLLNINGAGILYSWIKNITNSTQTYQKMNIDAGRVPIGSDGLQIIPFGNGAERMLNNIDKGASIFHLNFNKHKQSHLFRAALEGIAFSFVYGMNILKDDGVNLDVLNAASDNLFQSEIFSKTIATLVDTPQIHILDTTGAIGAARAAGFSNQEINTDVFLNNKPVRTYLPDKNKSAYIDAYSAWKENLEIT